MRLRHRPVQFRAVVRFSIFDPKWTGWRATNSGEFTSPEAYREYLWSADRLRPRVETFATLAAPLYQELAERHDFRVLVQHSPDLPEPWLGRLHELAKEYPAVRPVPVPGWTEARDTVAQDLRRDGRTAPVAMLRVDDDDLLSVDFLDQLLPHITPEHDGWCVSLGQGLAARWGGDGLVDFRQLSSPLIAIGQTFLGRYRKLGRRLALSPLLSHRAVPETLPTIVDSRSVSFVHVRHPHQDTRVGKDTASAEEAVARELRKLKPVTDFSPLRPKFPSLTTAFDAAEAAAGPGGR